MQALPWLPRPLIIFVMIGETLTPCVQWHGQDSEGNMSEEQILFPIYGKDSELIECVRPQYWRIWFLGGISAWNESHPEQPLARVVGDKVMKDDGAPIVRIVANECSRMNTASLACQVVQVGGEDGVLYSPATYENRDVEEELPKHNLDEKLQREWRQFYQDLECPNIEFAIDKMYLGYPGLYASRYAVWLREQRRLDEEFALDLR